MGAFSPQVSTVLLRSSKQGIQIRNFQEMSEPNTGDASKVSQRARCVVQGSLSACLRRVQQKGDGFAYFS